MPSPELDLLALQERLRGDAAGTERRRLQQQLEELRISIRRRIDTGLRPPEFQSLQSLLSAVETGETLLLATWQGYHPDTVA
jgi:type III secretion system YseE family protein